MTLPMKLAEDRQGLLGALGIQGSERLVQQQDARGHGQHPR
jgi:hypothetical protein